MPPIDPNKGYNNPLQTEYERRRQQPLAPLTPPPTWQPQEDYPSAPDLTGPPPAGVRPEIWEGIYSRGVERETGYEPGFWDSPVSIARAYNELQSLPPGAEPPPWYDRDLISAAYNYMSARNNGTPWWTWDYMEPDDPGREIIAGMRSPVDFGLVRDERGQWVEKPPEPIPPQPESIDLLTLSDDEYDKLPLGHRIMLGILSGGQAPGVMGAGMGLAQGGISGAIGGFLAGQGLGGLATKFPGLAEFLYKLDYPAEWLERGIGAAGLLLSVAQANIANALPGGAEYPGVPGVDDLLKNWRNLFKAGHFTYEAFQPGLDAGETRQVWGWDEQGRPVLRTIDDTQANLSAVLEAYMRLNEGESLDEIANDYRMRFGLGAEFREQLGHLILDPLNVAGAFAAKGIGKVAKVAGNLPLSMAAKGSAGLIETAQQYGSFLRQGAFGAPSPSAMTGLQRWLAGVDASGQLKILRQPNAKPGALNKLGGAIVAGGPMAAIGFGIGGPVGATIGGAIGGSLGWKQGFSYLTSLTPAARATEVVNNGGVNMALLIDRVDNADDLLRVHKGIASTPMDVARETGMKSLDSPEAAALPLMVRDAVPKVETLVNQYKRDSWAIQMLDNIASVTGRSVDDVLRQLEDGKAADTLLRQYVDTARQAGGEAAAEIIRAFDDKSLTAKSLQNMFRAFVTDSRPYNFDMLKGQAYALDIEHAAKWAADWFKVEPDPAFIRLGKTIKSAQSLVLLGLNPTYFVNNAINNVVTMAAGGVFGMRKMSNIDALWKRVGVKPAKLKAGVGAMSAGDIPIEAIRAATQSEGMLGDLERFFGRASDKLGVFSRASTSVEQWSSAQAVTSGFLQAWRRLWKPGAGFDRMPGALETALSSIDLDLPRLVYDAIQGGLNRGEIESVLWSGVTRRSMDSLVPDVARGFGLDEASARDAIYSAVDDTFTEAVRTAGDDNGKIRDAFGDLYSRVEQNLDEAHKAELEVEVQKAAARVQVEGAQAAFEIFDRSSYEYVEHWFGHFVHMEETARMVEEAKLIGAPTGGIWRREFGIAQKSWNRFYQRQQAQFLGIANALGVKSDVSRAVLENVVDQQKGWDGFYKLRDSLYEKMQAGEMSFEEVQVQLMGEYDKVFARQERIFDRLDKAFTRLFSGQYGREAKGAAENWRAGVKEIRGQMHQAMADHRALGGREWSDFLRSDYLVQMQELHRRNVEGAAEMFRLATGSRVEPSLAPEMPKLGETDWQMGGSNIDEGLRAQAERAAEERAAREAASVPEPTRPTEEAPAVEPPKTGKPKPYDIAYEIARQRIVDRFMEANGERVYIIPQFTVEVNGRQYLIPTNSILKELGAQSDDLNYYRLPVPDTERLVEVPEPVPPSPVAGRTLSQMSPEGLKREGWQRGITGLLNAVNADRMLAKLNRGRAEPFVNIRDVPKDLYDATKAEMQAAGEWGRVLDVPFDEAVTAMRKRLTPADQEKAQVQYIQGAVDEAARTVDEAAPKVEVEPVKVEEALPVEAPPARIVDEPPAVNAPLGTVEKLTDAEPPISRMTEEGWNNTVLPLLRRLEQQMTGPGAKVRTTVKGANLDPATLAQLREYMAGVYGQMQDTKLASIRWGEHKRDAALLNYSRRYGWDNLAQTVMPYHFWPTRSAFQWFLRTVDRPAWLANYARMRTLQDRYTNGPGFPSRLKRKMRMPLAFLPEWMGPVYFDPLRQLFPFEQIFRGLDQYKENRTQQERQAAYIVDQMLEDGEIDEAQARQALDTKQGQVWQQAIAQAQAEMENDVSSPADFASLMLGYSLPLEWARKFRKGEQDSIRMLPVTEGIQAITSLMTPGGVNIESPIRQGLGLKPRGASFDFLVMRELASMAADGSITADEAQAAMVDREGDVYQMALDRVGKVGALRYAGRPVSVDTFEPGEEKFRLLHQEYRALLDGGATSAQLADFYDQHPEYEAYKLSKKADDPEAMLKGFLLRQVWDNWYELPALHQRQLSDAFGETWENFLNKETRSVDAIDIPTLTYWAQAMGAQVPKTAPDLPASDIGLAPPEIAESYQRYSEERNRLFPGWYELQEAYYSLPEGQRPEYPEMLSRYTAWKNQQFADHPELIEYAGAQEPQAWEGGKLPIANADPQTQAMYYQYQAQKERHFPGIYETQDAYYDLPTNKRDDYKRKHPELEAYWDWNRAFQAQYPQLIPYLRSVESIAEKVLGESYKAPERVVVINPDDLSGPLVSRLTGYYYAGQGLDSGTRKALRQIWERYGRPADSFEAWIDGQLRIQFGR